MMDVVYKYIDTDGDVLEVLEDSLIDKDGKVKATGIFFRTPENGVSMFRTDILEFAETLIRIYDKLTVKEEK